MTSVPFRSWIPRDIKGWLYFFRQQALSCVFPWSLLSFLAITHHLPAVIPRYDAMLIICVVLQYILYKAKWETDREVKVIASFHIIGLTLELVKTHLGCWSYPEPCWLRIGRVPLFSGFLYASVSSYCCQAWRRLDLHLHRWPGDWKPLVLAVAIYVNFFTEGIVGDFRWVLIGMLILVFWNTRISYRLPDGRRRMPLVVGLLGVGFSIWVAENIGTLCGAWRYPYQRHSWCMVDFSKLTSWFLLVMITFLIVAELKRILKRGPSADGVLDIGIAAPSSPGSAHRRAQLQTPGL